MLEQTAIEHEIDIAQTPFEKAKALNALSQDICNADSHRSKLLAEEVISLYESLNQKSQQEKDWLTQHADALISLSIVNGRTENIDHSLIQATKALEIYGQTGNQKGQATALNQIGAIHFQLAEYGKALDYYFKSLNQFKELNDNRGQLRLLNNIGYVYYRLAEYEKAMLYLKNSLEIAEAIDDLLLQAGTGLNIGNVYFELTNYEQAMVYITKTLSIAESIGNLHLQASSNHNMGNIYSERSEYDMAMKYLKAGLIIAETIDDLQLQASSLHNIGSVYYQLGLYKNASDYFTKSHSLFEKLGDRCGQVNSLIKFGQTQTKLMCFDEADSYFKKALSICEELGLKKERYKVLEFLSQLCYDRGSFAQAYHLHQQFQLAKEEVFNQEQHQKMTRMQIVYETEKNKKEIELLRVKNEELTKALDEIGRLKELVTMCAWTGKVKMNDKWIRIEDYLIRTFGISVSHGMSDEAADAMRKELQKMKDE